MNKNCEICEHFCIGTWYYNSRKNPPIHYIVFTNPIVKIPSPKRQRSKAVFFMYMFKIDEK